MRGTGKRAERKNSKAEYPKAEQKRTKGCGCEAEESGSEVRKLTERKAQKKGSKAEATKRSGTEKGEPR